MPNDLIVFAEDWGGMPTSSQYLVQGLQQNWRVLWINSIGLRRPRVSIYDMKRILTKFKAYSRRSSNSITAPNINILNPLILPFPGNSLVDAVNRCWLSHQIKKAMKRCEFTQPILWASLPSAIHVVGQLNERAVVYYCCDDFNSLVGVDHKPIALMEKQLVEVADLIIVTSDELAKRFPKEKTHLIPHGVSLTEFVEPQSRPDDLPKAGPIAGFYGSLAEWVDFDLLVALAKQLPDWQFVLIGPVRSDLSKLQTLPNIHILGPKPHHMLSAYVQHWQVSLLPFCNTDQIKACNPLKLMEYLAVGKPIVSTDFPAVRQFDDLIYVAKSAQQFAKAIQASFHEPSHVRESRQKSVAQESWANRASQVDKLLATLLEKQCKIS